MDLKEKTIRGGVARLAAQAANFVVRVGALMILARLLGPREFGLVGMVTAFTGVLDMFRDFGLSAAAVQRKTVTDFILGQFAGWCNPRDSGIRFGAGGCSVLPRTSPACGHDSVGSWIPFQRDGCPARSDPSAGDALYCFGCH